MNRHYRLQRSVFYLLLAAGFWSLASCTHEKKAPALREGTWRGVLTLVDSIDLTLPFNFDLLFRDDSTRFTIHNAEERIPVDDISFTDDSVFIRMPVFDSEFRCKRSGDTLLTGNWINHSRKDKNIIPFTATYGQTFRFDCPAYDTNYRYEGKWKCLFSPHQPDSAWAVGIFRQTAHGATGTFLTETGDYRYLEGCLFGNFMQLSCFDGSHAFVFHAEIMPDSTIWGEFYSGLHLHQTWIAWKDSTFKLRNADSLTSLKKGFSKVEFSFPDLENKKVSLADAKYRNKVVVVQIMGSWCPNCLDETYLLAELYKKYKAQGLEMIALAFEKAEDPEKAKSNLNRLKNRTQADYDFLLTGIQPADADKALLMIEHVMSFPTTIFLDRKGNVRRIHTGYSGPATGKAYEHTKEDMTVLIEKLLKE